jgi:putative hydrolase of the HAD superfamily
MLKAAIFDWGGVIMRTEDASGRRKWEQKLQLSPYAVDRVVHGSRSWKAAQSGEISDARYWADVAEQLGLSPAQLAEFRHDYFRGDRLDRDMIQFIRNLRPRFKTALLSNASPQLEKLLEELDVTEAFDEIVISGLVGVQKPRAEIYRIVLERLGLPARQTLFIDDFIENVRGAQAVGMQAIHFRPQMDWRSELSQRLYDENQQTLARE